MLSINPVNWHTKTPPAIMNDTITVAIHPLKNNLKFF